MSYSFRKWNFKDKTLSRYGILYLLEQSWGEERYLLLLPNCLHFAWHFKWMYNSSCSVETGFGYSRPRFFQISMFWNLMANSKFLIYRFHVKLYGHSLKRCVWEKNLMSTDDGQGLSSVALWAYVIKFSWLFNLFCISLNYFPILNQ